MKYRMFVKGIPLDINIGLFDSEREKKQTVLCDIELWVNFNSNSYDNVNDTVNYYEVTKNIIQKVNHIKEFILLESLANIILDEIGLFKNIVEAKIKLKKTNLEKKIGLGAKECGVVVQREFNT